MTWRFVRGEPFGGFQPALDIEFDEEDPERVWAGGKGDQAIPVVRRSEDGGRTWRTILPFGGDLFNPFTGFLYDEGRRELWATASDALFVSRDGGETWETGAVLRGVGGTLWGSEILRDGRILVFGIGDPHGDGETGASFHMRIFVMDRDVGETTEVSFGDRVRELPGVFEVEPLDRRTVLLGTEDGVFRWDLPEGWQVHLN